MIQINAFRDTMWRNNCFIYMIGLQPLLSTDKASDVPSKKQHHNPTTLRTSHPLCLLKLLPRTLADVGAKYSALCKTQCPQTPLNHTNLLSSTTDSPLPGSIDVKISCNGRPCHRIAIRCRICRIHLKTRCFLSVRAL